MVFISEEQGNKPSFSSEEQGNKSYVKNWGTHLNANMLQDSVQVKFNISIFPRTLRSIGGS